MLLRMNRAKRGESIPIGFSAIPGVNLGAFSECRKGSGEPSIALARAAYIRRP